MDLQLQLFLRKITVSPTLKMLGVVSELQTETTPTPLTVIQ